MSRVALLGMAPLPFERASRHHAPGIRSWQLARPLLRAGHRVRLLLCRYAEAYDGTLPERQGLDLPEGDGCAELFTPGAFGSDRLRESLEAEPVDVLVGAASWGSSRAVELAGHRPVWADLFGHTLAEGQAKAMHHGDDDLLLPYWQMEVRTILRADAFSVVSRAQGDALLGELGVAGRLCAATAGYAFAHVIPCAAPDPAPPDPGAPPIRGRVVPEDAYVALWIGGYNTWADAGTLLAGLEQAMDAEPRLHFLSTGGSLTGQDDETYEALRSRVGQSRHAGRFHWLGWVDPATLARCLRESDVGLNVDRDIPESRFGSRNRIPVMLAHGLPVVSSRVSEVSVMVEDLDGGLTFPPGDASALAGRLVELASGTRAFMGGPALAARAAALLSFEATAAPLLPFVAAPRRAPDAGRPRALDARVRQGMEAGLAVLDAKDRENAQLQQRIEDVSRHARNLAALVEEKDAALVELRRFERRVKSLAPIRALLALRGRG